MSRQYTRRKTSILTTQAKKGIFGLIFVFLGFVALFAETNSLFGFYLFEILSFLFGEYYKWIFSPPTILFAFYLFKEDDIHFDLYRLIGMIFYFSATVTIVGIFKGEYRAFFNLFPILETPLGESTTLFASFLILLFSLVILFKFSPVRFTKSMVKTLPRVNELKSNISADAKKMLKEVREKDSTISDKKGKELKNMLSELKKEKETLEKARNDKEIALKKQEAMKGNKKVEVIKVDSGFGFFSGKKSGEKIKKTPEQQEFRNWKLPSLDFLTFHKTKLQVDQNEIRRKEIEIQEKLLQFKIEVDMEGCQVGPTVIQYRLKPRDGVKLQKIESLKKDLTLALQAKSIRIQAPIPGLGVVGIEVPNDNRQIVGLRELVSSKEFNTGKHDIPIAVGKDVNGELVVGDLTKMPHLLVAGQTASGKSVGMNGFIISMLYKFSPSDLKMILIDPKRVELSVYNGIPHLLTPVITNPDKALNALKWAVAEMLRRYDLETTVKARNLKEYNDKVSKNEQLPYIVIIIDELVDLMMSGNKKEVEGSIARIAQMARAVGMHLIVATQRPSVDVITGLIKANIPSRIAFTVASQVDSRTVIDGIGAEDLLGRGDMLYAPTGSLSPVRVQGVLVDTDEVEAVVNQIKLTIDPDMINNLYDESIASGKSNLEGSVLANYEGDQAEDPEIIEKAIEVVKESKKGSTSLIQRKLGLGYARAAKVLDILEDIGVVGPANGSKPREVYID